MSEEALIAPEVRESDQSASRRTSRVAAGLALLVIALAGALALALILWPRDPGNDSPEAGFARDMSAHHAQAVEMATIVHDRTGDEDLFFLTTDITLTQQNEIGQMDAWLDMWGLSPTGDDPPMAWMGHEVEGRMPGMASQEEVEALRTMPVDEMNKEFLRLMIVHHQAGIEMAQGILDRSDNEQVTRMAERIVTTQQAEIKVMTEKLAQLEGQTPAATPAASPEATPHPSH